LVIGNSEGQSNANGRQITSLNQVPKAIPQPRAAEA
jgi:hypothetical protein